MKLLNRLILIFSITLLVSSNVAAESFGTTEGTLPNITNIQVYDITGLSANQRETGGNLETEGLNTTLEVRQESATRDYRFEFNVVNDGNQDWTLQSADEMFQNNLNNTWTVEKIWYNISSDYDSGTFSSGRVDWNTTQGGTVSPGQELHAKYNVQISPSTTRVYDQRFEVNDTSNNSGSFTEYDFRLVKIGDTTLAFNDPVNDTTVTQNKTFPVNATISCNNGDCGKITANTRYNESSTVDTLIPENSGTPFHTTSNNLKTCSSFLKTGESCDVTWDVNATGDLQTYHEIDVNISSNFSEISSKNTEDRLLQINAAAIINLSWNKIDFGVIDPGTANTSAPGNDNLAYNISVPQSSNTVDNLWIRATNLTSQQWARYNIRPSNLSYSLTNDVSTETQISDTYSLMDTQLSPGTVLNTFYWLDVPESIYKGEYTGTIYFKANITG